MPIRFEVGPKDIAKNQVVAVRRDTGVKAPMALDSFVETTKSLLETIQSDMFAKAKRVRDQQLAWVTKWEDFVPSLNDKKIVMIPWCEAVSCEEQIKERSAKT